MIQRMAKILAVAALGLFACWQAVGASEVYHVRPAYCEPGFQIIEETEYQTVVRKVCKVVPDVHKIKKTVYSTKNEFFCLPSLGCCMDGCCNTPACSEPQCRSLLIKREVVTECPSYKCVIEDVVEQVQCKVYRKVPCNQVSPMALPATAMPPAK